MSDGTMDRLNLLAPDTLAQIARALESGPIFGLHYVPYSGGGPDSVLFRTFDAFRTHLTRAKAGDLFEFWSLPALLAQQRSLLHVAFTDDSRDTDAALVAAGLQVIDAGLSVRFNEFFAICLSRDGDTDDVFLSNDVAELRLVIESYRQPGCTVAVFPYAQNEQIDTHDSRLLWATYPRTESQTPIGGVS